MMFRMMKWKRNFQGEPLRNIQNLVARMKRKEDEEREQATKEKDILQRSRSIPIHHEKTQGTRKDKRVSKDLLLQRNALRPNTGEE